MTEGNGSEAGVDLVEVDAFAASAHDGQMRESGEPYITHPRAVRAILEHELTEPVPPSTLAVALLHDVLEDCDVHPRILTERFGTQIQEAVTLLSWNIRALGIDRNHRIYWSGIRNGPRSVRLVKGADRIHNIRESLGTQNARLQEKYLRETPDDLLPVLEDAGESWLVEQLTPLVGELERALG